MTSKKRKILYISGTRADYGLIRETLFLIGKNPKLKVEIVATGMHLMPKFGQTIDEIKKDGFKVYPIRAIFKQDSKEAQVQFIGDFISNLLREIPKIKPDIIFIQGDRPEMLAAAIAGMYLGIPVAHTHGGDVSLTVDETSRHAITKLSHIHFPATKKSAGRIIKTGEDPWRVFVVGAPGLDAILKSEIITPEALAAKYNLNLSEQVSLVLHHSITSDTKEAGLQMREIMEAIKEIGKQAIVIYPSADPGANQIINTIKKYRKYPFIKIYKNIPRKDYLGLLNVASVLIGNSSSGLIEAPSFKLSVVNVGLRQWGRERTGNIIDVSCDKEQIKKAVRKALYDKKFRAKVEKSKTPYGDGKAGERIADILAKIKIDKKLLQKQITY